MNNYNSELASRKGRKAIDSSSKNICALCLHYQIDSASEFQWPCLIVKDWICESHCTEVKMKDYPDTRNLIMKRLEDFEGTNNDSIDLIKKYCERCPYFEA